jgi:NAD-dependent deacetylase
MLNKALPVIQQADILIVVGTSLNVYPAAGLIGYAKINVKKHLVDSHFTGSQRGDFNIISESETVGIPILLSKLSE